MKKHVELMGYHAEIYWSVEDHAYIIEIPALTGCMSDGATYKEALQSAEIVIQEWIETATSLGRDVPEPLGKLAYD